VSIGRETGGGSGSFLRGFCAHGGREGVFKVNDEKQTENVTRVD
jgi:hypothetical protein